MTRAPKLNFPKEQLLKGGQVPPRREPKPTSSKYIGVTYDKERAIWKAYIHVTIANSSKRTTRNFGSYAEEEDAARARDRGVLYLFDQVC
jgi:hypothetical protein